MIHLFSDYLGRNGGIETYLHALGTKLLDEGIPFRIAVAEMEPCMVLPELERRGVPVDRQRRVPGDRWRVRQRLMVFRLARRIKPGDWVFCVRQPMPEIYLQLVRAVHRRGGRIAVSWMLAPMYAPPPPGRLGAAYRAAVSETDRVISVSNCTLDQFREVYGYIWPVDVVRYHNLPIFQSAVPLPAAPPWRIGFIGRIEVQQKNLDRIFEAFRIVARKRPDAYLELFGDGPDIAMLREMAAEMGLADRVTFHGSYDHRTELQGIMARCHVFLYTSRYEGGPCFSLLELLQAGRFVVASPVGGIPDIYAGHPDVGTLVDPADSHAIATAIDEALEKIALGQVDAASIRRRYEDEFTMDNAHAAWMQSLGI